MSRNDERLPTEQPQQPEKQHTQSATLFSIPIPTEFVSLPSKGEFYPPNHPLYKKEVVEIKYMTTKEEEILNSVSLRKEGIALEQLLTSLICDKTIDTRSLLSGDRNAILLQARISGYGVDYTPTILCEICGTASDFLFNLQEVEYTGIIADNSIEMETTDANTFITILPMTKAKIEFRLLSGFDESFLEQSIKFKKKQKLMPTPLADQLRAMIVSINGETDESYINMFIETLPALDAHYLRRLYTRVMPNVNITRTFKCGNCHTDRELEVPLTAEFFWPKQ